MSYRDYCECGEELDYDCNGSPRCPVCDPPCPCCSDGLGYEGEVVMEIITPIKAAALLARLGEGIEEALERVEREVSDCVRKMKEQRPS